MYRCDQVLQDIIGQKLASTGDMVRLIWRYIKDKKLQCEHDRTLIKPDQKLAKLMGEEGKEMKAFGMMKFVKLHFSPM